MRLSNRLRRLEQQLPDPGCLACRDRRDRTVIVIAEKLPDGSVVQEVGDPEPCVWCGEVPERIIKIVESLVEGEEDGAPLGQRGLPGPT